MKEEREKGREGERVGRGEKNMGGCCLWLLLLPVVRGASEPQGATIAAPIKRPE
jgi:hypothetical protein